MGKSLPERSCIGCGQQRPKNELRRIVLQRLPDHTIDIHFDPSGKESGRGAYLCNHMECLEKAWKRKGLDRSFRMTINSAAYEALKKELVVN